MKFRKVYSTLPNDLKTATPYRAIALIDFIAQTESDRYPLQ